ncbi:lipopolysaccharide biosynthesis protein [Halothermothrix orenii H 168]|uniref:Lipopolysaccharide biosynthesis protein n=1 Tax=Halothermothrix orenii (strain H 168 / OCM 544 / DSM 9562) TaxID=373903 RepID=B8D182_HALOH|nr:lipopolysaccharide biosynthesis protein [Halothermothrix orenii H 168]
MEEKRNYDEYEIDLREYIRVLWKGRYLILGLMVIALLITGVYFKLFTSPVYEARATLLIIPPTYKTSLEVATLPLDTYKNLAMTDTMKADIIEKLKLNNIDGESYTTSDLGDKMSIEILTGSNPNRRDSLEAPLIVLKVKSKKPELASKIANTWAELFMEATRKIRKGEVREISLVIEEQFNDTREKLNEVQNKLEEFREQTRPGLVEIELEVKEKRLREYSDKLLEIKTDLGSVQAEYNHFKDMVKEQEDKGEWLGELGENNTSQDDIPIVEARNKYLASQAELMNFFKDHDLDLLKEEIEVKRKLLKNYYQKLASLENKLKTRQVEIDRINSLLENEPSTWELERSLTDDVFWEKVFTPEEIKALKDLRLTDEIINPI